MGNTNLGGGMMLPRWLVHGQLGLEGLPCVSPGVRSNIQQGAAHTGPCAEEQYLIPSMSAAGTRNEFSPAVRS